MLIAVSTVAQVQRKKKELWRAGKGPNEVSYPVV